MGGGGVVVVWVAALCPSFCLGRDVGDVVAVREPDCSLACAEEVKGMGGWVDKRAREGAG